MNNLAKIKALQDNDWRVMIGGKEPTCWAQVRRGGRIFHCENVNQDWALDDAIKATDPFNQRAKDDDRKPVKVHMEPIWAHQAREFLVEYQNKNSSVLDALDTVYRDIRISAHLGHRRCSCIAKNKEIRAIIRDRLAELGYMTSYFKCFDSDTGIEVTW